MTSLLGSTWVSTTKTIHQRCFRWSGDWYGGLRFSRKISFLSAHIRNPVCFGPFVEISKSDRSPKSKTFFLQCVRFVASGKKFWRRAIQKSIFSVFWPKPTRRVPLSHTRDQLQRTLSTRALAHTHAHTHTHTHTHTHYTPTIR